MGLLGSSGPARRAERSWRESKFRPFADLQPAKLGAGVGIAGVLAQLCSMARRRRLALLPATALRPVAVMAEGRLGAIGNAPNGAPWRTKASTLSVAPSRGTGGSADCLDGAGTAGSPWNRATAWRPTLEAHRLISSKVRLGHQLSATAAQASGRSLLRRQFGAPDPIAVEQPRDQVARRGESPGQGDGVTVAPCCRAIRGCRIAGARCQTTTCYPTKPANPTVRQAASRFRLVPHDHRELSIERQRLGGRLRGPLRPQLGARFGCYRPSGAIRLNLPGGTSPAALSRPILATPTAWTR